MRSHTNIPCTDVTRTPSGAAQPNAMTGHAALLSRLALYLDLIRWNRPAGWLLLLWPTLSALWIAADGWPGWHLGCSCWARS